MGETHCEEIMLEETEKTKTKRKRKNENRVTAHWEIMKQNSTEVDFRLSFESDRLLSLQTMFVT